MCGRSVRWWDDELKAKIQERREVYKRIVRGEDDLWGSIVSYIHREVKGLVIDKKLKIWNGVVEKANLILKVTRRSFGHL